MSSKRKQAVLALILAVASNVDADRTVEGGSLSLFSCITANGVCYGSHIDDVLEDRAAIG